MTCDRIAEGNSHGSAGEDAANGPPPGSDRPPVAAMSRRYRSAGPASAATPAAIHHELDGLAGIYRSEAEAQRVLSDLLSVHEVRRDHLVLLGPPDARWLRFVFTARQWNRRPYQHDPLRLKRIGVAALAGAIGGILVVSSGLLPSDLGAPDLLVGSMAALVGAIMGAAGVGLLHRQQPQFKPFDRLLRRKLGEGC